VVTSCVSITNNVRGDNMQATVTRISDGVWVRVRRNYRDEPLDKPNTLPIMKRGDKIVVKRKTNNPYLQFVSFLTQER
jgi:hypothetical protein